MFGDRTKMLEALLAGAFRRRERPVGLSWRLDETCVKVSGQWKSLYRAVDGDGHAVDFLPRAKRDHAATRACFELAMDRHGVPEKITIDKRGANTAAILSLQADSGLPIEMRRSKYLNNLIEQDHRAVKRITRPRLQRVSSTHWLFDRRGPRSNAGPLLAIATEPFAIIRTARATRNRSTPD